MIKKAVVFVETGKALDGVPVPLVKVSGVPLLKRLVIDARRAGLEEVFVLLDAPDTAVEHYFARAGLKAKLLVMSRDDWRAEVPASRGGGVLLLEGDRLFDFRALAALRAVRMEDYKAVVAVDLLPPEAEPRPERRYTENNGRLLDDNALPAGDAQAGVGAYLLAPGLLEPMVLAGGDVRRRLAADLVSRGQAAFFDIGNGFAQPVNTRAGVRLAEKRLLRYIWKETDGRHARLNKRIALPLIKVFLKTPLTPNVISFMGVFISLAAGYYFSRGTYLYGIVGALISYVSALFDHVDGSVARLKSMESAFGSHFETVCDFVFYFSFGIGLTAGMYRATHNQVYLGFGVALVFGTLMSLLTITYQRKLAKNPSQFAKQAHRKFDTLVHQNALYRFGRKTYYLARRPVLPYYVLVFAVLNALPVVLFLAVVGANMFWAVLMHSSRPSRVRAETGAET